jgi:hypothetical protein
MFTVATKQLDKVITLLKTKCYFGVAEKHDICGIQRKIPQVSDFAKKRDSNPAPHGDTVADIAKMFAKIFLRKSDFG